MRREFSKAMQRAINNFPDSAEMITRHISFMPSFYKTTGYVFLQIRYRGDDDYGTEYRSKRRSILTLACGVARNKFPHLSKIVGIAIDAPKFTKINSEDFVLLNCETWPDEQRQFYEEQNKGFKFFELSESQVRDKNRQQFSSADKSEKRAKVGRNELCPCGSGKKYKKCHGSLSHRG